MTDRPATVTPAAAAKSLGHSDVATLDWLTLRECANDAGVGVEVVRSWCVRFRSGLAGGLRYAHFGAKPEEESRRTSYRVHTRDWEAFKSERLKEEREQPRPAQFVAAPLDYCGNRRAK